MAQLAIATEAEPRKAKAAVRAKSSDIVGFLDAVEGRRVFGWAWDRTNPGERLAIEISDGGKMIATATANLSRPDLKANAIGDGGHAFEAELPEGTAGGALLAVAVCAATGQRHELEWGSASKAERGPGGSRIEPLLDMLSTSQRRALASMQAAERKFDAAAAKLQRLPEFAKTLEEIRTAQSDLARRIAEAEVFLVRFDGVLSTLQRVGTRDTTENAPARPGPHLLKGMTASFDRPARLVAGLAAFGVLVIFLAVALAVAH